MNKKVSKNIVVLGFVSFLNDIASEMIYPVIPIFLSAILGVPASIIGVIEGLADATSKILMTVSGYWSDRLHKRKIFVGTGYSFAAVSHLFMAVSSSWPLVLFSRVLQRAGKGLRTAARDAIISESVEKTSRGFAFGLHRTMDALGGVIGPLLAIVLLPLLANNYKALFLLAFIPAIIGAFIIFLHVKDKKSTPGDDLTMRFEWKKTNRPFRIFLLISFIFAIGNSADAFLILKSQELGLSVSLTIFSYVLFNFVSSLFSIPAGVMSDKIGPKKVLFVGFLVFSLVYFLFATAKEPSVVWILFSLYGVYAAMTDGVSKSYISQLVPHEVSGFAFGVYQTAMGVATLIASSVAGVLWTSVGSSAPFYYGFGTALLSAVLFFGLSKAKLLPTNP